MMHENWQALCYDLGTMLYDAGIDEYTNDQTKTPVDGFTVLPRMDGGFGAYYRIPWATPFAQLAEIIHRKLIAFQVIFEAHDVTATLTPPSKDGATEFLVCRVGVREKARVRVGIGNK